MGNFWSFVAIFNNRDNIEANNGRFHFSFINPCLSRLLNICLFLRGYILLRPAEIGGRSCFYFNKNNIISVCCHDIDFGFFESVVTVEYQPVFGLKIRRCNIFASVTDLFRCFCQNSFNPLFLMMSLLVIDALLPV